MGHLRDGSVPRTREWKEVVGLIQAGADVGQIATATIYAAEVGLGGIFNDAGAVETTWLLMQLPLSAKAADFGLALHRCGLDVSSAPSLMEIVAGLSEAIDGTLANNRGRTDLGEMAQMAAAETVAGHVGGLTANLFGASPDDVRRAFAGLDTVAKFGEFYRHYFARYTFKCLDYYLSRTLSAQVGAGRRFNTLAQQAAFASALETHCREAAAVVERFAGEWRAKTDREKGTITRTDAAVFLHGAMKKLLAALKAGGRQHVH
jgi:hypothetical protein